MKPFDQLEENSPARRALQRFAPGSSPLRTALVSLIASFSRALVLRGNSVEFRHSERLEEARRVPGRGLLTFSNHVCLFDDPWLTACLVEPGWEELRWIAVDALNFFGDPLRALLFNAGKCVPVIRGAGWRQPGTAFLAERLRQGDWVHIFPEGGRTREPDLSLRRPFKVGLAHLVRDGRPLLLPFHHRGMDKVLPIGAWIPRVGHSIQVCFGEVSDSDSDLGLADRSPEEIMLWAEEALLELEAR